MAEIITLIHSPIGIGSILLIILAIGLFIWNLCKEELTHEQWLEIRNRRLPDLECIKDVIGEYVRYTFQLIKPSSNPRLYNLDSYYSDKKPLISELLRDIVVDGNKSYSRLKTEDERLGDIRTDLEDLVSRLSSGKLRKMVSELYRREHLARSYQIYLKIRGTQYHNASQVEALMLKSDIIRALATYLKKIYGFIAFMERGKDLE